MRYDKGNLVTYLGFWGFWTAYKLGPARPEPKDRVNQSKSVGNFCSGFPFGPKWPVAQTDLSLKSLLRGGYLN